VKDDDCGSSVDHFPKMRDAIAKTGRPVRLSSHIPCILSRARQSPASGRVLHSPTNRPVVRVCRWCTQFTALGLITRSPAAGSTRLLPRLSRLRSQPIVTATDMRMPFHRELLTQRMVVNHAQLCPHNWGHHGHVAGRPRPVSTYFEISAETRVTADPSIIVATRFG
jgi:hypothetical protein